MTRTLALMFAMLSLPAAAQEGSEPTESAEKAKPAKKGMKTHFGLAPLIGAGIYNAGPQAKPQANFMLGGRAQVSYKSRAALGGQGSTYVRYAHVFGSQRSADDFRVGTIIGPKLSVFSLQAGVEIQHTRYSFNDRFYPGAWSLGVPMIMNLDVKVVDLYAGAIPAWFVGNADGRQPTDWSQSSVPGFGDEIDYVAGIGLHLGPIRVGVSSQTRVGAFGAETMVSLGTTYDFKGK